jgi:DNA modification methylase
LRFKANKHIAKTPRFIAAWAVSQFTQPGDWVFDPTIGSGTTGVEAKKQNRHILGIELNRNWARMTAANCQQYPGKHLILNADVLDYIDRLERFEPVQLVVSNPPYSGDENVGIRTDSDGEVTDREFSWYDADKRNLAFKKENKDYYNTMNRIYNTIGRTLIHPGGFLVIGVKDMMRAKRPYLLHYNLANEIDTRIFDFHGTWILPHYPRTLFMNTYPKFYPGTKVPLYQTISVWRKK